MSVEFTPEVLAGISGLFLTLCFSYFPKLRVWYAGLAGEVKSFIMLGLLFLSASAITALAHFGVVQTAEPVTWLVFAKVMLAGLIANQPVYQVLPKAADVKAAKWERDNE